MYAFTAHMGVERDYFFKWNIKKGKMTLVALRTTDTNPVAEGGAATYTYQIKGESTTEKAYNAYVKKLKVGKAVKLASTKFKSYQPASTKAKAIAYLKKWTKKQGIASVDRIDYEGYSSSWGYSLRGVKSHPTHDATLYWYYVDKSGHVINYWSMQR